MGKLPAILLYDGDWIKDSIAGCSLAAQGLWLRMMFIGHNSERYGYLQQNGVPIPPESIARRCGCTLAEYTTLLCELDAASVPSRTPEGIIFSRRMVRDANERAQAKVRKQKQRSRSCHADVTPIEDVNVKVPVLEVAFEKKFVLPVWIPEEAWSGYALMRLKNRKPMTDRARELVIKKLEKLLGEGNDIEQVLNNSVIGNWTDVYPLKEQQNGREQSKSAKRDERNRENLAAGLRAVHGDSAMDVLGFTGTKHRDPVVRTDAVVVSGPKVLPPRSD